MPKALTDRLYPLFDKYKYKSTAHVERREFAEHQHKEEEQQHSVEPLAVAEHQLSDNEQQHNIERPSNSERRGFLRRLFGLYTSRP
jgi:hypothetical protein